MSDEWEDVSDQWVDVSAPQATTVDDSYSGRLSNPENWRDLASGGLRGFAAIAELPDMLLTGHSGRVSGAIGQLVQAITGDPQAMEYGKETGVGAVGSMLPLAPTALASVPAAIGYAATSAGAGIGREIGNKAGVGGLGEFIGALSPTAFGLVKALTTKGVPSMLGLNKIDPEILSTPEVQRSLQLAERMGPGEYGYLNKPAAKITNAGQGTVDAIELVNQRAKMLPENIAAQLGADAGDTAVEKALSEQFNKAVPQLIKKGVFDNVEDVGGLAQKTQDRLAEINKERMALLEDFEPKARQQMRVNRAARLDENDAMGVVSVKSPEIQSAIEELNGRVKKLSQTELAGGKAEAIQKTAQSIIGDLKRKPVTPRVAVEMQQNLNEVRRDLLREFDSLNIAKKIDGNTPGNLGSLEASIEAVSTLQRAISKALDTAVKPLGGKGKQFADLNSEYGALKSLEDMTDKFLRGTAKGRATRDPTRIVQNSGAESLLPSAFSPQREAQQWAVSKLWKALTDNPGDSLKRAQAIESRDADAVKNIQDLLYLNKSPVNLPQGGYDPTTEALVRALLGGAAPAAVESQ